MVALLAPTPLAAVDPFEPSKLDTLAKWSSAGFVTLTSILTFFGIKDGLLTRVLSEDPTAALWAFLMIGAGVVLSLFGLAVKAAMHLFIGWVSAALLGMSVCSALLLNDFGEASCTTNSMLGVALGGLLIVTIVAFVKRWSIVLGAALLILAVSATSMGLYAAAKISVAAKAAPETMRVGTKLTVTGDSPSLEVTLAGSKQNDGIVELVGYREVPSRLDGVDQAATETGRVLWATTFSADETRTVTETYTVPVDTRQWAEVSVKLCTEKTDKDPAKTVCHPQEQASYLAGAALRPVSVAGSITTAAAGKELVATVTADHLLSTQRVKIQFQPLGVKARAKVKTVLLSSAIPDATGKVQWTAQLPHRGVRWALNAVVCDTFAEADFKRNDKTRVKENMCTTAGRQKIVALYRPPR